MFNLLVLSPLEQFDVINVLGWFSHNLAMFFNLPSFLLTNAGLFILLTIFFGGLVGWHYMINLSWIPAATQNYLYILEVLAKELIVLVYRNVGLAVGQLYFPWLVFIFFTIAGLNLIGIIPFTFTITSHIIVTFFLSFTLFMGINIRALLDKKFHFFSLFLPSGAPMVIAPFLVIIELISYVARVFSLAIRLFANMMAGHTLLKILIGFSYLIIVDSLTNNWPLFFVGLIPFFLVYIITFLEVAIALLQAYVFTVLLCLYIKDLYVGH